MAMTYPYKNMVASKLRSELIFYSMVESTVSNEMFLVQSDKQNLTLKPQDKKEKEKNNMYL